MNNPHIAARAFALLVLGAVCIGFAPLFVRFSDVGPVASAFWRMLLAAPVLWLIVLRNERRAAAAAAPEATTIVAANPAALPTPAVVRALRRAALWSGLFFAADLGIWHYSITMTTVAN